MSENKIVLLKNDKNSNPKFKRSRGYEPKQEIEDLEDEQIKYIKEAQKEILRDSNIIFYSNQKLRNEKRKIHFEKNIDLIKINFFTIFNKDLINKFEERYGLSPVSFSDFNKTVILEIIDPKRFLNFGAHLKMVIESPNKTKYEGEVFNLIALIQKFEFIGSSYRMQTSREDGVLVTLASSSNAIYKTQKDELFNYLNTNKIDYTFNTNTPDIIDIKYILKNDIKFIADNFDIIHLITSTRALKVRSGEYGGVRREFGFTIESNERLPIVGIIDSGINVLDPLREIIIQTSYDHTNTGAFWDELGHGTMVAGLVTLGEDFLKEIKEKYIAKARLMSIKALHFNNDEINIPQLILDIRDAKNKFNVRIFNMSLNIPKAKRYNEGFSQFAYELDKLAFEEDIIIFISVGNFDEESLNNLIYSDPHPDHAYPTFFYNPNITSQVHDCKNTNICEPSESLNNISVGALAGNFNEIDSTDISPNNISPAYYTRKFHYDYSLIINNQRLKRNQKNKNINKPDLVFEGGDLFKYDSGLEILRSPNEINDKYYGRSCGTSLSTPLITSYAAEILNIYPNLKSQTIKALLINSASYYNKISLPEFKTSTDILLKNLVGYGKPNKKSLLSTGDNEILFIIEDKINISQLLTIPIFLPPYLKENGNKLKVNITLCFSFLPIKDNHLNYLPLQISFNIIKNVDIKVAASGSQDIYGIKSGFSWSEDHFGIENRIFSNSQTKSYTIQPNDLNTIGDSIALGVRCLSKNNIPESELERLKCQEHHFSAVIRITELPENKVTNNLYNEMINCNNIEIISNIDLEATLDN
jgi:hypothetical protein